MSSQAPSDVLAVAAGRLFRKIVRHRVDDSNTGHYISTFAHRASVFRQSTAAERSHRAQRQATPAGSNRMPIHSYSV